VYGVLSGAVALASVLPTVLFVVMVMAGVVGVMSLAARNDVYDEIRRGPWSLDRDAGAARGDRVEAGAESEQSDRAAEQAERELEIRQMLEARSARIVRAGGSPLDIDAELAKLAPAEVAQEQLGTEPWRAGEQGERELEIRQMLEARSARIVRAGGSPLDVDAELERLLGEVESTPRDLP
jgi:hypothetical protein